VSTVSCVRAPDGVAEIVMADAAGQNAMTPPFVHALEAALSEAEAWPELRVVVLRGLPDVFSSGASRELLAAFARGEIAPTEIVLARRVLDLGVPVVAAMEGHAVGGGLALGLCADVVVLARESRYGATFMNMGFTPGMGMTRLFEHVLSPAIAHELLYTGELRRGAAFEGRSGVNAILPRAEVLSHARALAARIADKPRAALELLKRTLALPRRQAFEQTLTIESLMHRVTFASEDVLARVEEAS
jgi:polyketide biosynthesis enoyl-CoA hydratase PksI